MWTVLGILVSCLFGRLSCYYETDFFSWIPMRSLCVWAHLWSIPWWTHRWEGLNRAIDEPCELRRASALTETKWRFAFNWPGVSVPLALVMNERITILKENSCSVAYLKSFPAHRKHFDLSATLALYYLPKPQQKKKNWTTFISFRITG